jgi:Zn-dependent protease with chaperone function
MGEELLAKCACSNCGTHLEFPVEAAGAVIDCPHCHQQTELTLNAPPVAPADGFSAAELIAAFQGGVPRTRVSFFYQIGLVLVTLTMIVLPLVYLAMIGAACWGIYLYATHFFPWLTTSYGGRRLYLLKLIAFFAPLFIGLVLLFFMIKPLFARRASVPRPLSLNPGVEATLFAFIAKICELVKAPMPARIDLDCQVNAAAGFRRGMRSLFAGDLVLTIGMPLVAGLTLREFAGIIAHEFGHFTQGFGMRFSYVTRSINGWFARVVYERDAWDVWLEETGMEAEDLKVLIVVNAARLAVGFSRLLLMGLMYLGHGFSCFLLRQMEYDADSYEIKLAGSDTFEATARRLAVLNESVGRAYKNMRTSWNINRRLPDNFPQYLVQEDAKTPPALRERILDRMGLSRTGLFDTHPSDGDRIRRSRQAGEPGIFHLDQPASILFSNFPIAAKQVTYLHYAEELELEFDPANLRPVEPEGSNAQVA